MNSASFTVVHNGAVHTDVYVSKHVRHYNVHALSTRVDLVARVKPNYHETLIRTYVEFV